MNSKRRIKYHTKFAHRNRNNSTISQVPNLTDFRKPYFSLELVYQTTRILFLINLEVYFNLSMIEYSFSEKAVDKVRDEFVKSSEDENLGIKMKGHI